MQSLIGGTQNGILVQTIVLNASVNGNFKRHVRFTLLIASTLYETPRAPT